MIRRSAEKRFRQTEDSELARKLEVRVRVESSAGLNVRQLNNAIYKLIQDDIRAGG